MASYYGRTAGGNWATAATWSTDVVLQATGAAAGSAPTAADDCFLVSGSGSITINTGSVCRSLNCTGYTGTVTHTAGVTLNVGDATAGASNVAVKLVSGMTYTGSSTGNFKFISTSVTQQTIDFASKTMGAVTWDGAGGSWQLTGTMTQNSSSAGCTVTNGTLDTNGQTCSWQSLGLGVGTKTLTLGASAISITASTSTVWSFGTNASGFTFNSGTSSITFGATGSVTASLGAQTYYDVSITGSGSVTITGGATFHNLTRSSTVQGSQALVVQNDITITNLFTCTGTNTANQGVRIVLSPSLVTNIGTQRTITVNGSYSFTNVDFNFINAAGSATLPWTGTSMGDGEGNSNITFDSPRTLYWIGVPTNWFTLARWSLSSGGAAASTVPLAQDDCKIDSNSGVTASGTFSTGLRFMGRNIDFTGMPNAATTTFAQGGFNPAIGGSLTWASGMALTASSAGAWNFSIGSRSVTLTNNGVTYPANWSNRCGGSGGTFNIADDLTMNANTTFTFDGGTLNAGTANVTVGVFSSNNANTRTLNMGSGTWTISGTSGQVWNYGVTTGLTHNGGTAPLIFSDTGASQKQMNSGSGSRTWYSIQVASSSGGLLFNNANFICTNLTISAPNTITVVTGQTITVTGTLTLVGSAGNVISILSTTGGTPFTFSKASGVVNADYVSLKDSTASGGAAFFAGPNSTNVSGNTGWTFNASGLVTSDATTLSEAIAQLLEISVNRSDSLTASEFVDVLRNASRDITVTDASTLTENQIAFLPFLVKLLSDSITVSESRTIDIPIGVNRSPTQYQDGPGVRIV
jgi:hypothetical protein